MREIQSYTKNYQENMSWDIDKRDYSKSRESLLNNYMLLTTEVAEVAEELRKYFNITNIYIKDGMSEKEAFELATKEIKENLGKEIADCLAYLFKFSIFFELDLEEVYYSKLKEVKNRQNKDIKL